MIVYNQGESYERREKQQGWYRLMYGNLKNGSLEIGTLLVILSIIFALIILANGYIGIGIWFIIFAIIVFLISKRKKSNKTSKRSIHESLETKIQSWDIEKNADWGGLIFRSLETRLMANTDFYNKGICPYCGEKLDSIAERKKKCKKCGTTIRVWTNLISKERMLITEEQAEELKKERAEVDRISRIKQICTKNGISEAQFANAKGKTNYPDNDVLWGLLNEKSIEHGQHGRWGLYRNTISSMFELVSSEGKPKVALQMLVEIIMLDANGVYNSGIPTKRFNKKLSFYVPGTASSLEKIKNQLNLNDTEFKDLFFKIAEKIYSRDMFLSVNDVWKKLRKELKKSTD